MDQRGGRSGPIASESRKKVTQLACVGPGNGVPPLAIQSQCGWCFLEDTNSAPRWPALHSRFSFWGVRRGRRRCAPRRTRSPRQETAAVDRRKWGACLLVCCCYRWRRLRGVQAERQSGLSYEHEKRQPIECEYDLYSISLRTYAEHILAATPTTMNLFQTNIFPLQRLPNPHQSRHRTAICVPDWRPA